MPASYVPTAVIGREAMLTRAPDAPFIPAPLRSLGVPLMPPVAQGFSDALVRLESIPVEKGGEQARASAVIGGRLFVERWGELASRLGWDANSIFAEPNGLAWRLGGATVKFIDHTRAVLNDGRDIFRADCLGPL